MTSDYYSVTSRSGTRWVWRVFAPGGWSVCSGVSRIRLTAELVGRYKARRLSADAFHAKMGE